MMSHMKLATIDYFDRFVKGYKTYEVLMIGKNQKDEDFLNPYPDGSPESEGWEEAENDSINDKELN